MLHSSEGSAKRSILIGAALLITLEILGDKTLLEYDLSDIRNAGLGLIHLLYFVHSMDLPCRLNDNGWKSKVLEKADGYEMAIEDTPV